MHVIFSGHRKEIFLSYFVTQLPSNEQELILNNTKTPRTKEKKNSPSNYLP